MFWCVSCNGGAWMVEIKQEIIFFHGKKLGHIDFTRSAYVSYRNENHQFYKYGNGFGLSVKLIDYLISKNINLVVINYKNQRGFVTEVNEFLTHGVEYDDDGDLQIILPQKFFRENFIEEKQENINKFEVIKV